MLRTPRRLFSLAQRCNAAPDTSSPGASSAVKCLHSRSQTKLSRSRCTSLGLGQANYGSAAALAYSGSSSSQEASTSYSQQRAAHGGERTPGNDPNRPEDGDRASVSDREWELRTGESNNSHAIDILQQTLPTFFSTGLVATGSHLLASALHLPSMNLHGLSGLLDAKGKGKEHAENNANVEDVRSEGPARSTETTQEGEQHEDNERCIYDRHIRLEHTPPFELPAPFPRTLSIEGLPIYVASSVMIRHAMLAIYTDLAVGLLKVAVRDGPDPTSDLSSTPDNRLVDTSNNRTSNRERAVTIALLVSGQGRLGLSTERGEWDITSTYTFCPKSGLIKRHTVNAIHPAPHEAVYTSLRTALGKLRLGGGRGLGLVESGGVLGKGSVGMTGGKKE